MARKQTRRTVSFNRAIYEAIKVEADRRGMPAAHFLESLVREAIPALPETAHLSLTRAKATESKRANSPALTERIAKVLAKRPQLLPTLAIVVPVPPRVPIESKIAGSDPIDQVLADVGDLTGLDNVSLSEREHRKRKRSVKVAKKLRERGLLTPENEGYASPESWSAAK